jgi:hypothetical protein
MLAQTTTASHGGSWNEPQLAGRPSTEKAVRGLYAGLVRLNL